MPVISDLYTYSFQEDQTGTPPLVLIHGAGGNHLSWPPEIRRLPGYRIYAPDLPGHGKSEGRGQQSIQSYAGLLLDWLAGLGIYQAVFIGHSMGGAIALALAIYHKDHVLGLGLFDTGAQLKVNPVILEKAANPTTYLSAVEMIVNASFSSSADPRMVELVGKRMAETRPSVLQGDFLACDSFNVTELVDQIHQPALIICGTEDRMTPMRYSQMLAGSISTSHLEVIPQAGHMAQLEQPQIVADALAKFLPLIPYTPGEVG